MLTCDLLYILYVFINVLLIVSIHVYIRTLFCDTYIVARHIFGQQITTTYSSVYCSLFNVFYILQNDLLDLYFILTEERYFQLVLGKG